MYVTISVEVWLNSGRTKSKKNKERRYEERERGKIYSFVIFFILQKMCLLHPRNMREIADYPNKQSYIRFDSIRFILYSTRFDSTYFFKIWIRFDLIRLSRIESNRIIRLFDPLSISVAYNLMNSMESRVQSLIDSSGDYTPYWRNTYKFFFVVYLW
jgi:hypothetical protein